LYDWRGYFRDPEDRYRERDIKIKRNS